MTTEKNAPIHPLVRDAVIVFVLMFTGAVIVTLTRVSHGITTMPEPVSSDYGMAFALMTTIGFLIVSSAAPEPKRLEHLAWVAVIVTCAYVFLGELMNVRMKEIEFLVTGAVMLVCMSVGFVLSFLVRLLYR